MNFKVGLTGPDHSPTAQTKWYAQVMLNSWDELPIGAKTFAFGDTPEKAMSELMLYLRAEALLLLFNTNKDTK